MAKRFFPLRIKLLVAVTVLVVVLTATVLAILNARLYTESLDALNADLSRTLSIFNSFVDEKTESLSDKATLLAGLPRLTASLDIKKAKFPDLAATVTELCLDLDNVVKADLFIVTDKAGRVLFDSHHIPEKILALKQGRDPDPKKMVPGPIVEAGSWSNVKMAFQGQSTKGGFLYKNAPLPGSKEKETTAAYQTVTFPISSRGNVLGVIILGLALDKNLAEGMKKMTESEIAFYINKQVFASTWPEANYPQVAASLGPIMPDAAQATRSFPVNLGGENYLCLFAPFKDTQGQVLGDYAILRSKDKALALQKNLQTSILAIGIGGIIFAFLLAIFIANRITAPLNSLLKGVQKVAEGNLDVQVPIQTHDELALLAGSFNQMIVGLKEKERVTNIFGKYVSPQVVKKILASKDGMTIEGERRECVVMFTDIRGFTAMSENMAPEKLVAELNEYFSLMVDTVVKYEGTFDKFIGDAIMAVWGAPVPFEDKELRAVKCALDMQEALNQLNVSRTQKGLPPLTMGIGLNSGVVVSGNLGSDKVKNYTVIGEEVNLASRLCSKAKPGQTLISDSMFRKLKGLVEMKALEPIPLKGFTDPVKVYEAVKIEG